MKIEFKKKAAYPEKIVREIVALANTEGGVLLLGVDDDGTVSGQRFIEEEIFVMEKAIYDLPVANWLFKAARTIPICSKQKNEQVYEAAFAAIKRELEQGNLVCIFPEGKLTSDGELNEFKNGIERIVAENPVPVIPMALQGLWGSFFSRDPHKGLFKRLWSRITLVAGTPVAPELAKRELLQAQVEALRGDWR